MAVWLMRAIAVENIIVRREEDVLFLPANPNFLNGGEAQIVAAALAHAHRLWQYAVRHKDLESAKERHQSGNVCPI
jgi:sirohydrochlorin cobaltochelatase